MDMSRCARCGVEFKPSRRGHVYCSPACRHLGPRNPGAQPPDPATVAWLFDEARDPDSRVLPDDWHGAPDFRELDARDTIEQRRRWYLSLLDAGRL